MSTYSADPYRWSREQADILRRRAWDELDVENVAEEIEDVGNSREDQIESRLENLLCHLLKWRHQPERLPNKSWRASIVEARYRIARLIKKNPSLRAYPGECLAEIYPAGRAKAAAETGRDDLPEACPWAIEQVLDPNFLP